MSRLRSYWYFWIGTVIIGVTCACGLVSPGVSSSVGNNAPSSSQSFAYTPNPLTVQITLDAQHVIKGQGQAGMIRPMGLTGKDPKGDNLDITFPGDFLTQEPDGTYDPAFGTSVTATPVSAIGGIPFAKGFVSAFQFGPEGLLMSQPVTVELTVPGTYNDLVGFASNGDGTDFHLIPIDAGPLGDTGQTIVIFDISHFSMYGVAEATAAEITAQQAHPPSDAGDNEDDLLAAPKSKKQVLTEEHDQLLKSYQSRGSCNDVITAARSFFKWLGNVQNAGLQDTFKSQIASDSNVLMTWLKDCVKDTCPTCLENQNTNQDQSQNQGQNKNQNNSRTLKEKQDAAKTILVLTNYIESVDQMQANSADANYYRELSRKCAKAAGLKDPSPPVADCYGSADCGKVTPTELACPAP